MIGRHSIWINNGAGAGEGCPRMNGSGIVQSGESFLGGGVHRGAQGYIGEWFRQVTEGSENIGTCGARETENFTRSMTSL